MASTTMTFSNQLLTLATTTARAVEDCGCSPDGATFANGDGNEGEGDTGEGDGTSAATLAPAPGLVAPWSGVLAVEGLLTGDGRLLEHDSICWRDLPIPFRWAEQDVGAHNGAVVVGMIQTITRVDGGALEATGVYDLSTEAGVQAYQQARNGFTRGISIDMDDVSFEVRVAADVVAEFDALLAEDADGEQAEPEVDADGRITVAKIGADDEVQVVYSGRISAATMVAIPAFAEAKVTEVGEPYTVEGSLVASGAALPPAEWFRNPALTGPTPLTVTPEGRVYGHLAAWETCHTGYTAKCVPPPRSATGYAYFTLGATTTTEGDVATGKITLDTTHADGNMTAAVAAAHYENTGHVVADVAVGEDVHGIWLAGSVRPGTSEVQVHALKAAPLSGDWRRIGSGLELVAALAVNMPGYPIPRPAGLVASGAVASLVAAGMVAPKVDEATAMEMDSEELKYLRRLVQRERAADEAARGEVAVALRTKVDQAVAARKVRVFAAGRKGR